MKSAGNRCISMLLLAVGLAGSAVAHAYSFTPSGSIFEARGTLAIQAGPYSGTCALEVHGRIDRSGRAIIEGDLSTLSGQTLCTQLWGSGNWAVVATSADNVEIRGIKVLGPLGTNCGGILAGTLIDGQLDLQGRFASNVGVSCTVRGELATTPAIGISSP